VSGRRLARRASGLGALVAGVCLATGSARAEAWEARAAGDVGVGRDLVGGVGHGFVGATLAVPLLARRLEIGGGLRLFMGGMETRVAVAGVVQGRLCVHRGAWSPALGAELELGNARAQDPPEEPPDSFVRDFTAAGREHALRAYVLLEPARFEWDRLQLTLGSLRLGTPIDGGAGRYVRVSLGLVRIGWTVSP
jgi:hypothetical protein